MFDLVLGAVIFGIQYFYVTNQDLSKAAWQGFAASIVALLWNVARAMLYKGPRIVYRIDW